MSNYLGFIPAQDQPFYFISYNSGDAERLEGLLSELNTRIPLWYDYGLTYGEEWNQEIADRIQNAEAVFFFLSHEVFAKGTKSYVYKEYEMARDFFQKPAFVFLLEPIENKDIPNSLLSWWIDVRRCQGIQCWEYADNQTIIKEVMRMIGKTNSVTVILTTEDDERFELLPGKYLIGKAEPCNLRLSSPWVSRIHCNISVSKDGAVSLVDLGPTNGTFINGNPVEEKGMAFLNDGDIIALGKYELRIQIDRTISEKN